MGHTVPEGEDTTRQPTKGRRHHPRMPEVEKQSAVASEGSGESLEKPGGLAFQVVLEDAKTTEGPKLECPATPTPSVEDIEKRLKEAESRRKSMEASALEKLALDEKKREEVRAKKAIRAEEEEKEGKEDKEGSEQKEADTE